VESEKINRISQHVESDAIPPSPNSSVSFEIIPEVTQDDNHTADEDVEDDEDQGHVMGDIQDSTAIRRTRRNLGKPSWLTTNIIVAYSLPIIEEASRLHIGKMKSVRNPRYRRIP